MYKDLTAERASLEAHILSMFSGLERQGGRAREGATAPKIERRHLLFILVTLPGPPRAPLGAFSRLPEVIPVRGDRTDV